MARVSSAVLYRPAGRWGAAPATNGAQVSDAIFCLTNQVRAKFGLPALRRDTRLDVAAALHSSDMALQNFFSHTSQDGRTAGDRATAQGYGSGVGENIASGYRSASDVVVAWMQSAGHCRNILSPALDVGVGTALSGGAGGPSYTQDFGDYFSQSVDQAPRSGCPYTIDVGALTDATGAAVPPGQVTAPATSTPNTPARARSRPAGRPAAYDASTATTRSPWPEHCAEILAELVAAVALAVAV